MAERVCFLMHLRPERVDEYLTAHREVWPEMLDALRRHGWRDYSLFVKPEAALVVGVVVCDDFAAALAGMDGEPVNARWQAAMAPLVSTGDGTRPDQGLDRLTEYFHLD
ncbi:MULTISPECIES: L-rhamnose mutarotase [unclassified Pseudonocardia]|uniref:L-rhamnose mutarotase n=1 Tax=unclassified Pseudonocardia TaxID=2619320 RepID=UPI0027E15A95|nr:MULTISPECIES: L-rhamnose mutarotase [unclassified Pseudonocardia]